MSLKTKIHQGLMSHTPWWINDWGQKILCRVTGHDPQQDQCLRPEHDFCIWCNKSMPGKAPRDAQA